MYREMRGFAFSLVGNVGLLFVDLQFEVCVTYKCLGTVAFLPRAGKRLGVVVSGMRRTIAGSISCPQTPCR